MPGLRSALRAALPKPIKSRLKSLYMGTLDFFDSEARRRDMIPPRKMIFVGGGDYKSVGLELRDLFTKYGGLKAEHRVLDVGCGIGRMAVPLTGYLSANAEYQGFDIVKRGIEWCQENITPRYPNFHFSHFDIYNDNYNPHGAYQASSHKFPYDSGSFDFVFLTSVFTHMFPSDMENYLSEISRVLKKHGTCFITFFLMNEESQDLIRKNPGTQAFIREIGGCFTTTPESPEAAIAFPEPYIRQLFGRFGLSISEPIRFGSWCGRQQFLSYQDIVIARKN